MKCRQISTQNKNTRLQSFPNFTFITLIHVSENIDRLIIGLFTDD